MGLSIHYSGKLKKATELQSLITEVQDIAISNNWNYLVFENAFENKAFSDEIDVEKLYGIMITPEKSEPLCFSFLSNGRMCGIINFNVLQIDKEIKEDITYSLVTKTQYAGFASHKKLVLVLDYVSKKYLTDFECIDQGSYWETRDETLLKSTFARYDMLIESFSSSLEQIPSRENENIEDYLLRIAESTNQRIQNSEEDTPILSLEDENNFKKLKLEMEHDAVFSKINSEMPPEIESLFLDNILQFEEQYKNAKKISVFKKLGEPVFKNIEHLNEVELEKELEKIYQLLHDNNMDLGVLYDYENENQLIYSFIINELFNVEVDDISISGMVTNFTYEEFHPNHKEDIIQYGYEFWNKYLNNYNQYFEEYTLNYIENKEELIAFKNAFKDFNIITNEIISVEFNLENETATAKVQLEFIGKIDNQNSITFKGESKLEFVLEYDYWTIINVSLI